jgi:hypothetical protein
MAWRGGAVTEGVRQALLLLIWPLGLLLAGALLPVGATGMGMHLALVAGTMLLALQVFRAPALGFALASLVTLVLFHRPLGLYVEALYRQASDLTMFMIVLFGGTLALVSRQDLLEQQAQRRREAGGGPPSEADHRLAREVQVLCVLNQFKDGVHRVSASRLVRGLLLLPLALVNFVSSAATALLFRSFWAPTRTDFTSDDEGRTLAAGILALCVSGCLVAYVGPFMSTWWLFFSQMAGEAWTPHWPLGVYLYGLLSYSHGFWLLSRHREETATAGGDDPALRRLYLALFGIALVVITVVFLLLVPERPDQGAAPPACEVTATVPPPPSASDQRWQARLAVSTVLLGILFAALAAQYLMYAFHLSPADERWSPAGFWRVLLQGMSGVFATVVLLAVILAFKDLLEGVVSGPGQAAPGPLPWEQAGLVLLAVGVTVAAGRYLGSSWGAFALGLLVLRLARVTDAAVAQTVVEVLILLATLANQRSPNADNPQVLLGGSQSNPANLRAVWSVPSLTLPFPWRRAVSAQQVQYALVALGTLVAVTQHLLWPALHG